MSYENNNNNNNSQEFDFDRENRSSTGNSREANRVRKNQQMQKNETRSAKHSSSGVSVGMTKPPIKPSFIIAAVTIFLVVIISVIFIIRSLPDGADTTPDTTTPVVTTPVETTPVVTTPADTTPGETTPADSTPVDTTPTVTTPVDTTPVDTTPVVTTPVETTPAQTTPADTTPVDTTPVETTPVETTPAETTPAAELRDVVYPNASLKGGLLVAVSASNPVVLPTEKVRDTQDPSIYYYEHLPYGKFTTYEGQRVVGLREYYMYMTRETSTALNDMLFDFIVATGGFSPENATRVGKPLLFKAFDESDLTSEFALGTTVYLKVTDGSATLTFSEADGYTWIYENAHKYGFILRYPEGKEEITGEQYNDGIFRYVGVPHATAMHQLDMCYEEYVATIKTTYTVENPYQVVYENVETGETESYLIYYVTAATGDNTNIPVYTETAEDAISISGDGANGFIVTIKE